MADNTMTQDFLKECVTYDPDTGIFIWNTRPLSHFKDLHAWSVTNSIYEGKVAGRLNREGYIEITIGYKFYRAHRLAFLYMEGYLPENCVDHIDKNKSNNKWENLREVSIMCNGQNCNLAKNNKTGITGVHLNKKTNKFISYIMTAGVAKRLGSFSNLDDAVIARYQEEVSNPLWTCSVESPAYKYLKERNLI